MNHYNTEESSLDFEFAHPYLSGDEYILWTGKPGKGRLLSPADAFLIPFSLFWCGFAVFWEVIAITSGAPPFFALFGLPFILVGLYLVFGRFIHALLLRKRTFYVITSKRILCKKGNRIDLLDGKDLPPMQIRLHSDGFGTITFGEEGYHYRRGRRYHIPPVLTLENIPEVTRVQQIIASNFQ